MKRVFVCTSLLLALALVAPAAQAGAVDLHSINYPEGTTVSLEFRATPVAPAAKVWSRVKFEKAQARIELNYEAMKPAILFGGDVTCYVLWAVTRDGETENLGEVIAANPKNQIIYRTGKKMFALMVTAESIYLAKRPSEIVVFISEPPNKEKFDFASFSFSDFAPAPDHAMEGIAQIAWDSKIPLELLQARVAYDLAGRSQAQTYARSIHLEAKESLDEAEGLLKKSPKSAKLRDAARQSVELSNEGINIARERIAQEEMAAIMAQRRAAMLALEEQAVAAEAELEVLAEKKRDLEMTTQKLAQQKAEAESEAAELGALLGAALSKVSEARNTAAGYVVSLPGILFDTNEATLKPEAEKPLAKLAGILLIMQGLGVTIDGYTDSTGDEEWNQKLSQARAKAVLEFLATEGVRSARMKAVGYGPENPIADNATPEGRSKNRRVEIVLAEVR